MIYIISGTDRPNSNSLKVSKCIQNIYKAIDVETEIINLESLPIHELNGSMYGKELPAGVREKINLIDDADGLIMVVPEYNGSFPGVLKYFMDFWSYPKSYEYRPVCFVGLGGMWGGLRPVEHLQGVFGYRNSFMFPDRIFIRDVWNVLKNDAIEDKTIKELLELQAAGFAKFVKSLKSSKLHALLR